MNVRRIAMSMALTLPLLSLTGVAARADESLAKSKNCYACHTLEKKFVGPSFKAISARYAGQTDAPAKLTEKVLKGGKGVWAKELGGEVPMPPNAALKPEDADKIVRWILSLK